jgi:hypothetical protein
MTSAESQIQATQSAHIVQTPRQQPHVNRLGTWEHIRSSANVAGEIVRLVPLPHSELTEDMEGKQKDPPHVMDSGAHWCFYHAAPHHGSDGVDLVNRSQLSSERIPLAREINHRLPVCLHYLH